MKNKKEKPKPSDERGNPGHWRFKKDILIEELRKKSGSEDGTTTVGVLKDLTSKSEERVKDFAEDLKDDGKRNYSNRRKYTKRKKAKRSKKKQRRK